MAFLVAEQQRFWTLGSREERYGLIALSRQLTVSPKIAMCGKYISTVSCTPSPVQNSSHPHGQPRRLSSQSQGEVPRWKSVAHAAARHSQKSLSAGLSEHGSNNGRS